MSRAKAKAEQGDEEKATHRGPGAPGRSMRPVRLDLTVADHERLERAARRRGLSKAAFARMAVLERLEAEDLQGSA